MSKSAYTKAHQMLVTTLAQMRREAGLHQADLAQKIGKDQSYISNIERGQRRVDVIEFYAILKAMGIDPVKAFATIAKKMPETIDI